MRATITDVDQRFSLQTQSFSNYLTIELPSGQRFQVPVDDEVVKVIIAESQGAPPEAPLEASPRRDGVRMPPPPHPIEDYEEAFKPFVPTHRQTNGHAVTPMGEDFMMEAPGNLAVVTKPEPVTLLELEDEGPQHTPVGDWPERELPHHVEEGMVDWQTLPDTQLPPSVKAVLRASQIPPLIMMSDLNNLKAEIVTHMANKPKAGKTDWNSGPKRQIENAPRRTVPRDEAGNPIPPGGILEMPERDPGEIRGGGGDDEDVQQA
jgi:hypothetical protein